MPHASTSYSYDRGLSPRTHERYIGDAVEAADSAVNFAGYDLYYFVANREASAISFSPAFIFGPDSTIHADGATIGFGATFGLDAWDWGFKVLNHETSHDFGLPDLYAGSDDHRYVGGWDLMGLISGHSPDYLAWEKWQFGWLTAAQIACFNLPAEADVDLSPVETPGGVKAVVLRTADQRVTVVEYRTDRGVDESACSTGVLVYTIDNAVLSGDGPILVQDGHPGEGLPAGCTDGARRRRSHAWRPRLRGRRRRHSHPRCFRRRNRAGARDQNVQLHAAGRPSRAAPDPHKDRLVGRDADRTADVQPDLCRLRGGTVGAAAVVQVGHLGDAQDRQYERGGHLDVQGGAATGALPARCAVGDRRVATAARLRNRGQPDPDGALNGGTSPGAIARIGAPLKGCSGGSADVLERPRADDPACW